MRPTTPSAFGDILVVCVVQRGEHRVTQRLGRQRARRVARVHARLFHVLHHASDEDVARRVAHGVDVDLNGVF
jgi:hypothetical protein